MENRSQNQLAGFKKNIKTVDAVSYNGRYVEASTLRNKIIYLSVALAALGSMVILLWL